MTRCLRVGLLVAAGVGLALPLPSAAASKRKAAPRAERSEASETPPAESAAAAPTDGGTSCAAAVSKRVQVHYESVRDLTARFQQTSQVVSLGTEAATPGAPSEGEVSFAKPGKMRWSYEQPEPSLVVTDGEALWIYDPSEKEAQVLRSGQGFLSGAALQFLLGHGEMARDFRVKALSCGSEEAVLQLNPKKPAAYEKLEVRVDATSGEVKETAVFDLVGNVTRVAFQDVRTNTGLADDLFRFTPPDGVRVVEVPTAQQ
jgi:outer membrane lipoprotein carrier protein